MKPPRNTKKPVISFTPSPTPHPEFCYCRPLLPLPLTLPPSRTAPLQTLTLRLPRTAPLRTRTLTAPRTAPLQTLTLRLEQTGSSAQWRIQRINVGGDAVFLSDKPLKAKETVTLAKAVDLIDYTITVTTSDVRGAGTDGQVRGYGTHSSNSNQG